MSAELRILTRIIGETFKGINRARLMNIVIITTMGAILAIFGCFLRSSLFISHFVSELGNSIEISIYLKPGKEPEAMKKTLLEYKNIEEIRIITKEQAWKDLKEQMELPEISNPLPDTIRVRLADRLEVDKFIRLVKKMDAVEEVQYAKQLAEQIGTVGYYANIAALIAIVVLGGLTLSIINNTIHLVIESRKQEIEIMRMMGVSDWYIKAPYILQGAFYGFWGAVLSIFPIFILNLYFEQLAGFFYIKTNYLNTNIVVFTVLLTGMTVGAIGSVAAIKKYLKT